MSGAKKGWYDGNHEGKLLRRGINKLAKKLNEAEDTDEIIKIINCISTAANAKQNLAKYLHLDTKINELLVLMKKQEARNILTDNMAHELPVRKED